jgi:hypothetical protein
VRRLGQTVDTAIVPKKSEIPVGTNPSHLESSPHRAERLGQTGLIVWTLYVYGLLHRSHTPVCQNADYTNKYTSGCLEAQSREQSIADFFSEDKQCAGL